MQDKEARKKLNHLLEAMIPSCPEVYETDSYYAGLYSYKSREFELEQLVKRKGTFHARLCKLEKLAEGYDVLVKTLNAFQEYLKVDVVKEAASPEKIVIKKRLGK